ncbi:small subunit ribosomal protein S6 [Halanaerobium saccharolyticum]|uniref:Small ribosomal subunit protein bS6 n=1 Tax=Halanaerobium saccharolyticum TaxID=43595 RepID=A0A4R7YQ07_9FIRM|nr:30S ribosomal protein S6 [Halanaerobium saccharolyticum]RAK05451.1 small subunit ribosomal protein S6 [Halanaerobium saccharolyticum]TDV99786.1 small subunit ribosomal protein S6 [Halanaerobium saccharolyticum]TDX52008.1 small subunit ribosomal protein S6 [Halanaerobium saccharolyticum]
MEARKRDYETTFVLKPDLEDEEKQNILQRVKDAISDHEGEVTEVDAWGKKQLAYEIKDYRSGDYTILEFNAQTTVVNELERIFKIMDGVIRYLVVRNDA